MTAEEQLKKLENVFLGLPDQLKSAVEAAYKDGWHDGYNSGLSDGHPLSSASAGVEESWEESDSKETIDNHL